MDYYAREKLECLLRDLENYIDEEFWRQMARISSGTTGLENPEDITENKTHIQFPVQLRKMWSGGEVQKWIDKNVNRVNHNACNLGVGCEEYGICYAAAQGEIDRCGAVYE